MNKRTLLCAMIVGSFLFSCSSDENETKGNNETNTPEYTAPAGFNWATSRNIQIAISSPIASLVSVYTDESCKEANRVVENLNTGNSAVLLDLNIPMGANTLYIKYPTATDTQIVSVDVTSATRSEAVSVTLPEDIVAPTDEMDAGWTFYHNTGVAMFEDNWPYTPTNAIDCDYNDVVLEYDLKVTECNDDDLLINQGYKEGFLMTMDVRAIGGLFPTKVGVVLGELESKYIGDVTTRLILKAGQGIEEELATGTYSTEARGYTHAKENSYSKVTVNTDHGAPVITLDGLKDLIDDQVYFQTTKGYINEGLPMLRAEIRFSLSATADRNEALNAYKELINDTQRQNFFICTRANKEIHMKGYKPTYSYAAQYEGDSEGLNEGFYCSNQSGFEGYVWGVKVPAETRHAFEKVPFAEAYPYFEAWKRSGGAEHKDWYMHPVKEKVVEFW